jgi:hypothetical protein
LVVQRFPKWPSAKNTNPQAVGFGMNVTETAAKKNKTAAMPMKKLNIGKFVIMYNLINV